MNRQEIFNKAISGIIQQKNPSIRDDHCCYRGMYGRKCAIGHLLSDTEYEPNMDDRDGMSVGQLRSNYGNLPLFNKLSNEDAIFLRELQKLHDNTNIVTEDNLSENFLTTFSRNAVAFAIKYNLNSDTCMEKAP